MTDKTRELTYMQAIAEALIQTMEKDRHVFLMGEGADGVRGIYETVLPAYEKFGSGRVIDTPLSENGLTGIAIGAAMDGLRPVLFHQRNDFMLLAMDQMANSAAKLRYVSSGKHKVPLTIVSFIARKVGEGVQHSQSLQALFAHIPGLKVVMPATSRDAKGLLAAAIQDDDPVIVLYHLAFFNQKGKVPEKFYTTPIGSARVVKRGSDVTVVSVSAALLEAQRAIDEIGGRVDIELIDLRSVRPIDKRTILDSVKKTGRLIVVDTGWSQFGVAAELLAFVSEEAHSFLKAAPRRITPPDVPTPATPYLECFYHPKADDIIRAVSEILK